MLAVFLKNIREKKPLIHNITNYVTANDCANILLACGATPIMAEDELEVEEVTAVCSGLCVNIGTPSPQKFRGIFKASKKANQMGIPVVLDPVGVGVSHFRTKETEDLLDAVSFDVIRGNLSEIIAITEGRSKETDSLIEEVRSCKVSVKGVDSEDGLIDGLIDGKVSDGSRPDNNKDNSNVVATTEYAVKIAELARKAAEIFDSIVVITGACDVVANFERAYIVDNGSPMMREVTGCGCQLSSLITAYVAANPENKLKATLAAVCAMGVAGEKAYERLTNIEGNATYRNYIIDAVYRMTGESLESAAYYNEVLIREP